MKPPSALRLLFSTAAWAFSILGTAVPSLWPAPCAASETGVFAAIATDGLDAGAGELLDLVSRARTRIELDRELADQLKTARRLAAVSPGSLLPIAVALDRTYGRLSAAGSSVEAFQIRALLAQLIEIHDSVADDFDEQAVTADLYVLLAASFFEQQSELLGIKYLRRALELDPANATALLELSKAQELRGRHDHAFRLLQDLRSMDLAGPEARLRLALNLDRFAQADAAVAELTSLVEAASPGWIRLIAFQELARIELERQRFQQADDMVSLALAEFPGDCTLVIAALHIAERAGRPAGSGTTPDSLSACGDATERSARMRYASRDSTDVQTVRDRLARLAEDLIAVLGAALQALQRGPGR